MLDPSEASASFTVDLEPGTYAAEWFSIDGRDTLADEQVTVERPRTTAFSGPPEMSGPTVLYLRNVARPSPSRPRGKERT